MAPFIYVCIYLFAVHLFKTFFAYCIILFIYLCCLMFISCDTGYGRASHFLCIVGYINLYSVLLYAKCFRKSFVYAYKLYTQYEFDKHYSKDGRIYIMQCSLNISEDCRNCSNQKMMFAINMWKGELIRLIFTGAMLLIIKSYFDHWI